MRRDRPLLVPAKPGGQAVHLRFDDALIEAREQDTLATALIAAGVLMTSRSPKYRRPRGPYCLTGDCGTCLVRVDGRPNVRACMTAVREGMRVSSQNSYKPRRLDPTAVVEVLSPVETAGLTPADIPALKERVRSLIVDARDRLARELG